MDEEVLEFVDIEFEDLKLSEELKEIVAAFISDIMQHEKVDLDDVTFVGSGKTCINFKIGEYVLKVGKTRRTKEFRNSSRILQPVIRREIETEDGDKMFIEVQNEVDAEWYKKVDKRELSSIMYEVYKGIREEGMVWTDIRYSNVGRLLKDNRVNYTNTVHDTQGRMVEKELNPDSEATGIKGAPRKILKAGEYVLLDTDFVFEENDLPNGKKHIKDVILEIYYESFEKRYQREKKEKSKESR